MLRIVLRYRSNGLLQSVRASGHAGDDAAGRNVACAAAMALLRTAGALLYEAGTAGGSARRPGSLRFTVAVPAGADASWLRGVSDFLLRGLQDLQKEHPSAVAVTVARGFGFIRCGREFPHGT